MRSPLGTIMSKETMDIINVFFGSIQALGAIATLCAFLYLFKKDKYKQDQINGLVSIANHLEAQNGLMKRSNELLSLQVDILNQEAQGKFEKSALNSKIAELEAKKIRLSAMPKLFMDGGFSRGYEGELQLNLNNKGERAILQSFSILEGELILHSLHLPYDLEKDAQRKIFLRSPDKRNTNDINYKIAITYEDALGYKYQSIIVGQGSKCKLTETQEINTTNTQFK
jgi:hypothetical protein